MSFTGNAMSTSFKREVLVKGHDFTASTGDTFKMSLYDNTATLTAATTAYDTSGELAATGNYTTGGNALTNVTPTASGTTALTDFVDEVWSLATFSAYGAQIYNDTHAGDASVMILDFGGVKKVVASEFLIEFPPADAVNAIIRIA